MPSANAALADAVTQIPISQTLLISTQSEGASTLLRGRLQLSAGATLTAPVAGQVAQVSVRKGQRVRVGQQLLSLSTKTAANDTELAPAENRQARAEAAQIAAASSQKAWQERVDQAHRRLEAAQQRVQIAQARVTQARTLVRRLQAGENVSAAEFKETSTRSQPHSAPVPSAQLTTREREAALGKDRQLKARADELAKASAAKQREADEAQQLSATKKKLWLDAQNAADALAITPKSTPVAAEDDKQTEGAAQPSAPNSSTRQRLAQEEANRLKLKADAADARAESLRLEANRIAKQAAALRSQSQKSSQRLASSLQQLRVFDDNAARPLHTNRETSSPTPPVPTAVRTDHISAAQAARIAQDAIAESRIAIADAERVRREVAGYERPIEKSRDQLDSATQRLDVAQEQLWDRAAQANPNLRSLPAPSDGTVLWVAAVAQEVKAGEALATVGSADRLEVVLHDSTGAWKNVRVGDSLMALLPSPNLATSQTSPPVTTSRALSEQREVPMTARVLAIQPPSSPRAAALLRVAIHNPSQAAGIGAPGEATSASNPSLRTYTPGTPIVCSIPRTGSSRGIAIPRTAVWLAPDGSRYVAVLAPVSDVSTTASEMSAEQYHVEWRKVQVGQGDKMQNWILSGLVVGERIVLQPATMQSLLQERGPDATVRLTQT